MQGLKRRVLQAILYEGIAIAVISPAIAFIYQKDIANSSFLSIIISGIAITWNLIFELIFNWWESRQKKRQRTFLRRTFHAIGFEGGLTLLLLPIIAYYLSISWVSALLTNIGLFVFFFFYAILFQWFFDKVFDVPNAAKELESHLI